MKMKDAEEYTQSLGQIVAGSYRQIALAESLGVPKALGLSIEDWVQRRLGGYIRLGIPDRREAVAELAAEGMSQRGIAGVLGVDQATVQRDLRDANAKPHKPHLSQNTGNDEWYTPAEYIEMARATMGGIDLDPASCEEANKIVMARKFYAKYNSGLDNPWFGRVWMAPPYSSNLIGRFVDKFVSHYLSKDITKGIVLVNNASDTVWFHHLLIHCNAVLFPKGRIRFYGANVEKSGPLQGQALFYFGADSNKFAEEFHDSGIALSRLEPLSI